MKNRFNLLLGSLAVIAMTQTAQAANLTWDADSLTVGAQDGSGTWITGAGNWRNTSTSTDNAAFTAGDTTTFGAGSDGSYAITVGGSFSSGPLLITNSGYTFSATSAQTVTLPSSPSSVANSISIASGKTATIGTNVTISQQNALVGGGGTLNISGTGAKLDSGGTTTLNIVGNTTVNVMTGGSLVAGNAPIVGRGADGSGTLIVSGGTVTAGNNLVLNNATSGTANATLTISSGSVAVSGTGGGLRYGNGSVSSVTTVSTTNLDGGTLTVGEVFLGNAGSTGINSIFNFNGGTLKVLTGSTVAGTFMTGLTSANVKDYGAFIDTNGIATSINQALLHGGALATDGGLTKNGAGTLTLTGANTYTGATTINTGTLTVGTGGTLGASTAALSVNNTNTGVGNAVALNLATAVNTVTGSLSGTIANPSSLTNTVTINNGGTGRNFTVNQTTNGTYAGVISGAGSFTLGASSTAALTLTGVNNYSGGTAVNAGRLISTRATAGGSTAVATGATLDYSIASGTTQGASSYTGAGTIQKTGIGTLTLGTTASSVALSAGGLIDVQGGTFKADDGSQNTSFSSNLGDINIASNAIFDGNNALVKVDKLTGTGTYQAGWFGARSITVGVNNGSSTFAGTLQGNGAGANGSAPLIKTGTGTFSLTGTVNITNNSNDTNAGDDVLRVTGGTSLLPSTLTLSPAGTSVIGSTSTKNTVSIAPSQNDVAIFNQTAGTINSTSISIGNTGVGTYNFSGGTTNANKVELAFTGPFGSTGEAKLNVSGSAALNVLSNGSIVMGNYYSRKATVVQTGGNVSLYSDAGTTLGGTGSLAFNGGGTASSYTLTGGTLAIPSITLLAAGGGAGGGTGAVNLNGGTLKITSASFAVPTGVTMNVQGDGAVANSGANIDTSGLTINFNAPLLHSGPNAIDGGLTKIGAGTLALSGASTYTGNTNVSAGTLLVNNTTGSGTGTGSVSVAAGATNATAVRLGGTGTISGATSFAADPDGASAQVGGIHSPGIAGSNAGVGTQIFKNSLTYQAGSIFEWDLKTGAVGTAGTDFDAVTIDSASGSLSVNDNATTGSIFKVVLGEAFGSPFWSDPAQKTWNVFATTNGAALGSSVFSRFQLFDTSSATVPVDFSSYGSFGFTNNGSTASLTWSAVPEPTSALAGLLITAGLLRRRRK